MRGYDYGPDDMADRIPDNRNNAVWTTTKGHGTPVACIAAGAASTQFTTDGSYVGVSPFANLYLIKITGCIKEPQTPGTAPEYRMTLPTIESIEEGLKQVIRALDDENIPGDRSVVLLTIALDQRPAQQELSDVQHEVFAKYFDLFEQRGVTVVMPAGNYGRAAPNTGGPPSPRAHLGDLLPQNHGKASNSLITVGSVTPRGSLHIGTTPEGEDPINPAPSHPSKGPGSITVYALGAQVASCSVDGQRRTFQGTSYATPAIAGLAAYLLALPENQELFEYSPDDYANGNTVGKRVKQFIRDSSYQRVPDSLKTDPTAGVYPYPIPPSINVGYNMAWGRMNAVRAEMLNAIRAEKMKAARAERNPAKTKFITRWKTPGVSATPVA
ncbi:peptidase S8/S53 domain-containing protein [Xylariomycetidae sp. FL0641]|nr:peptidase S8/S53 domain-containing protein [Xylariomycetidae sp. FL0641]